MSIDTTAEELIHFSKAGKSFPGKKPCLQTLHRWRLRGVRGVKLETCMVGGLRYTSQEAIQRFIAAQNPEESNGPTITASQRRKQAETANRLLQEAGV